MTNRLQYGKPAKIFHWLIVALLAVQYPIGWFMPDIHPGMTPGAGMVFHLSIGLTILALIPLALFFWTGWIVWAILLRVSGMRHPSVTEWPEITPARRILAACALFMLILTFTYLPIAPSDSDTSLLGSLSGIFGSFHHTRIMH